MPTAGLRGIKAVKLFYYSVLKRGIRRGAGVGFKTRPVILHPWRAYRGTHSGQFEPNQGSGGFQVSRVGGNGFESHASLGLGRLESRPYCWVILSARPPYSEHRAPSETQGTGRPLCS